MKITFLSNFLTPHQLPFCLEMQAQTQVEFTFVATEPTQAEQLALGYPELNEAYDFVVRAYESAEMKMLAQKLADEADVAIIGSASMEFVTSRLKQNRLTFLYSERIYKKGYNRWKWPLRVYRFYEKYGRYKSLYLLCASAYAAGDFSRTLTFRKKSYRWGYFPELKQYTDVAVMVAAKKPASILWAGRMIDWKHPEYAIELAKRLKQAGYAFSLGMIGRGAMEDELRQRVAAEGLEKNIVFLGAMSPEDVRTHMEQSQIFLFTSNRQEGWGAVLNESMNSGCAVVAGSAIGAVPFMIRDGVNGLIFQDENVDDLYAKVKCLLDTNGLCQKIGIEAYRSMDEYWNARIATMRLLKLFQAMLNGERYPQLYIDGPCSPAPVLSER